MPTTRSQGRNEPLQRLETPPKRQQSEAADLREAATASTARKRMRNDDSEDEPTAKRQQFSTPQQKTSNSLWMFGEKANTDHPRTAPSKSLAASSLRRPARGPLSRRSVLLGTPQTHTAPSSSHRSKKVIRPIQTPSYNSADEELSEATSQAQSQSQQHAQQQMQSTSLATPSRGLFGSLRGIVNKGLGLAASLSPIAPRTAPQPPLQPISTPSLAHVQYPNLQPTVEDAESPAIGAQNTPSPAQTPSRYAHVERNGNRTQRESVPESARRSSRYDHLHYVSADTDSVTRAANGEIEMPENNYQPQSPTSRIKAQNPQLSDAAIESIVKRRERKAAMEYERSRPQQPEAEPTVAPLFGPDSHYARGTVDPRFIPSTPVYGSGTKRKLEHFGVEQPQSRNRGFGIDDDFFSEESEPELSSIPLPGEALGAVASPAKKQKINNSVPVTPRSALKKPGGMSSIGRKSVTFGGSMARDIRSHYGPAGQYKGSTFADDSPGTDSTLSSIDHTDIISPTTQFNTIANSGNRPSILDNLGANIPPIDFTLRDPNDENWRPSLANPRPGAFRVPDIDEEDPDESMSEDTPEQPQTPRMSHAELPSAPNAVASQPVAESTTAHEPTDVALDKARSKAEKYKPKSSSRLSNVEKARSRSPSPDGHTEDEDDTVAVTATEPPKPAPLAPTTAPAVQPLGAPPQPFVPRQLDNQIKGPDGMTDYEREHQYDDWAANLKWDAPQTYEDAGTGSAYIHNLIRKNWTDEDSKRSEAFWAKEFDEVDAAMKNAKKLGHKLNLVTGMEGVEC